jgi:hypothetical protein
LALFLVIVEVVLGVMLLIGYQSKFTIGSLLLMIVLFTFLTFYSAYFDVVKELLFGDFKIKTLGILHEGCCFILHFILFINQKLVKPVLQTAFKTS